MEKLSTISRNTNRNQMALFYMCLNPEIVKKLVTCFDDDELCELLGFCEVTMTFNVSKKDDGFSKDLTLFIEMPEYDEKGATQEQIDEQMKADRKELLAIRQRIEELCGIE